VDGRANEALIAFLKKALAIPASKLRLARGETSRQKDVLCQGIDVESVRKALLG
jgi:uncharacterized protein YggU (UPF0235/DUF167 family)